MRIPRHLVGRVLGKRGETIKALRAQTAALVELAGWLPATLPRVAPLVYAHGDEEQVVALLSAHAVPELSAVPRELWKCMPIERCDEGVRLRLAEAGVDVELDRVDLSALSGARRRSCCLVACDLVDS